MDKNITYSASIFYQGLAKCFPYLRQKTLNAIWKDGCKLFPWLWERGQNSPWGSSCLLRRNSMALCKNEGPLAEVALHKWTKMMKVASLDSVIGHFCEGIASVPSECLSLVQEEFWTWEWKHIWEGTPFGGKRTQNRGCWLVPAEKGHQGGASNGHPWQAHSDAWDRFKVAPITFSKSVARDYWESTPLYSCTQC